MNAPQILSIFTRRDAPSQSTEPSTGQGHVVLQPVLVDWEEKGWFPSPADIVSSDKNF
jgi:hypothetical protein